MSEPVRRGDVFVANLDPTIGVEIKKKGSVVVVSNDTMADPTIVREWLDKADEDFNFAKINLEERDNFYPQICFHFHQAAQQLMCYLCLLSYVCMLGLFLTQ